jgi:hypothetical protein
MNAENTQTEAPTHNPALALADRFAAQLLRAALDALANQRTLWPVTPQQQQQEVIDRLRNTFTDVIQRQMHAVAAAGLAFCEVGMHTITAKGETVKAIVTVGDNKTLHELVDAIGRKVVLVLVDAETYTAGMESFAAQKDQPELPLEDGNTPAVELSPEERDALADARRAEGAEVDPSVDLARFEEGARAEAERFQQRASGVIDGRSERVKHQDAQAYPEAPKFPPSSDGEAA